MQTGRWRGDRALFPREASLVVDAVALVRRPARGDVRRKRHFAEPRDRFIEARMAEVEGESHLAFPPPRLDSRGQGAEQTDLFALAEHNAVAHFKPLGRTR